MAHMVRLLVASTQMELIASIKSGLQGKMDIEMIVNIQKPADAENKITRQLLNILLIDLDTVPPDDMRVRAMQSKFNLMPVYTAYSSARAASVHKAGSVSFILKPAVFTNVTAGYFVTSLYQRIVGYRKQNTPPDYRDLTRLVDTANPRHSKKIVAVASSTGGTEALEKILRVLPVDMPPMVVVQHMPSGFTKLFADRLNNIYKMEIKEADTGDFLKQGLMLLAPADRHMRLVQQQGKLAVECFTGTKLHGVMPAADILFESVADLVKANAIGVILTGMGADGARGLMLMHNAGAKTIGQDAASCVVYGMPKVARDLGALDFELPIEKIAEKIMSLV